MSARGEVLWIDWTGRVYREEDPPPSDDSRPLWSASASAAAAEFAADAITHEEPQS